MVFIAPMMFHLILVAERNLHLKSCVCETSKPNEHVSTQHNRSHITYRDSETSALDLQPSARQARAKLL